MAHIIKARNVFLRHGLDTIEDAVGLAALGGLIWLGFIAAGVA